VQIYNTLTRSKQELVPSTGGIVKIYVCGPTVYDYFHVGNARVFITFDAFRRYLEFRGLNTRLVQNFTDIDDKMIKRAKEEGVTVSQLADRFISEYFKDADALGIKRADVHPRATENIGLIIDMIQALVNKGYAYEADGDVYFEAQKFKGYGKLSHQDMEQLRAGARVQPDEKKKDPMDFALWKAEKPGEPSWDSPWGKGRPGWHIECSAMAKRFLGETIDIHAGGPDLIFPHHENEIAQSEAASGKTFARYWMHVGYLNINNEKMSKSLGNFFTAREVMQKFKPESVRFFMLSAHYRNPINFSPELLQQAENGLERLYNAIGNLDHLGKSVKFQEAQPHEMGYLDTLKSLRQKFIEVMDDDFNTADGISVLFEIAREANTRLGPNSSAEVIIKTSKALKELGGVLGLLQRKSEVLDSEIEHMIQLRQQARKVKNWAEADRIRDELKEMGIILEDTPSGVRWRCAL
jgi:cysteinyl-tRNA synthetase